MLALMKKQFEQRLEKNRAELPCRQEKLDDGKHRQFRQLLLDGIEAKSVGRTDNAYFAALRKRANDLNQPAR